MGFFPLRNQGRDEATIFAPSQRDALVRGSQPTKAPGMGTWGWGQDSGRGTGRVSPSNGHRRPFPPHPPGHEGTEPKCLWLRNESLRLRPALPSNIWG